MSDQAALLRAILDHPDDEAARLVYADCLDDQGDSARAEFIRLQCQLARYSHSEDLPFESGIEAGRLLPSHRRAFLAPFLELGLTEAASRYHYGAESGCAFSFRRGFVEDVEVFAGPAALRFVEQAERVFALTPLRHLRFLLDNAGPGEPAVADALHRKALRAFVGLPEVARLLTLDLRGQNLGDQGARSLLGSPHLTARTRVLFAGNGVSEDAQTALRERFGDAISCDRGYDSTLPDDIPF